MSDLVTPINLNIDEDMKDFQYCLDFLRSRLEDTEDEKDFPFLLNAMARILKAQNYTLPL